MHTLSKILKDLIFSSALLALLICPLIFFLQEILIFPAILTTSSLLQTAGQTIPEDITQHFITTSDGQQLELWYLPAPTAPGERIAIFFHGNGDTLFQALHLQNWLTKHGWSTYSFDYRGFGRSTGWPSESGLQRDTEAVWEFVVSHHDLTHTPVLLTGYSVGTGPAAYLAAKVQPTALLLLAPYTSMPDAVAEHPFYRHFTFLLRYELPTMQYLKGLDSTCVVVGHGEQDQVLTIGHTQRLIAQFSDHPNFQAIISPVARHHNVHIELEGQLFKALNTCISAKQVIANKE